jgi:hypothetical protein
MSGDQERDAPRQHPNCVDFTKQELEELKQKINEVWMLAYPESMVELGKEKLRVFNLYQDLRDTRWNYRVLHKAYNEMDKERNERRKETT